MDNSPVGSPSTRARPARTMRAAAILEPGKIGMREVAVPDPGEDEVRLKIEGCGVCASNLGPWQGLPWLKYPLEPGDSGHEAWGVIDAVGRGVKGYKEGDRVAALSYRAYAEYDVSKSHSLIRIPDQLGNAEFPGEPLACAMNIFARSQIEAGQDVAIIGIGFLGALLTRLASNAGARVLAISRRDFSLDLARRFGAAELIPMHDHGAIIERVRELTAGRFCPRVIEAVGKQWPLDLAAELTATRGKLVVAGYHQDGPRQVNMQLWNWRGIDVVNAHEREDAVYVRGMEQALEQVMSGAIDPSPLYTHRFPLEALDRALDATRDRPEGFLKALVIP